MKLNNENLIITNKYDNEFIGLLNEVGIRMKYFNNNKNTIKSWISILIKPSITEKEKKNRNLYAIKLLNQMINGYIKYPFNTYAKEGDIKKISVVNLKSELTNKFYDEINSKKIECLGKIRQKQFLLTYPKFSITNTLSNDANTNNFSINEESNKYNNKNHVEKFGNIRNLNIMNNSNLNSQKINDIINELEDKIQESDLIIKNQNEEINKLKNMIAELHKKEEI